MAPGTPVQPPLRRGSPTAGLVHRNDIVGSIARFWARSYAPDYITILLVVALFVLIQIFVTPFHRLFSVSDLAISYPHAERERVSPLQLLIYGLLVPLAFLLIWAATFRPSVHKANVTFLGLLLSVFLTALLTDVVKNAVGRPRPDLLARCRPPPATPRDKLVDWTVCTEKRHHVLHDGWRSFPSGHSSFAFSGLGYVALFLAAQLRVFSSATSLPASLAPLIPLVGAALIAISRTEDYRHDVWDVCAGSALGMLIAWGSWRRYYPSVMGAKPDVPQPARGEGSVGKGRGREKRSDEEERVGLRDIDSEVESEGEEAHSLGTGRAEANLEGGRIR